MSRPVTAENRFTAPAADDPRGRIPLAVAAHAMWCETCRLIHAKELACEIVMARVHALIVEPGDELLEDDLVGVARVELISALRLRGIAIDVHADGTMHAVSTTDTGGVPVHVEDEDTAPLPGRGR